MGKSSVALTGDPFLDQNGAIYYAIAIHSKFLTEVMTDRLGDLGIIEIHFPFLYGTLRNEYSNFEVESPTPAHDGEIEASNFERIKRVYEDHYAQS